MTDDYDTHTDIDTSSRDRGFVNRMHRTRIVLAVVLVVLILMLIGLSIFFVRLIEPAGSSSAQTGSSDLEWVRSIYSFGSGNNEQLLAPTTAASGPGGSMYVTDPQRGRILVFSPDGTFRESLGFPGTETGSAWRPDAIAVGDAGTLYVTDRLAQRVLVLDSTGDLLNEWRVEGIGGIDHADDDVLVISNGRVLRYSEAGEELGTLGRRGRGLGDALSATYGVTAGDGHYYVADAHNASIKAFDASGRLVWVQTSIAPGTPGMTPEEAMDHVPVTEGTLEVFELPQDLTLDAAGRLVAVDAFAFKIVVLDPTDGRVIAAYGEPGADDGLLGYPTSIDYDAGRDWFVVADTANDRVQVFRLPDSGGGLQQAIGRVLVSPFRICAVPLALLLLALMLLMVSSQRRV